MRECESCGTDDPEDFPSRIAALCMDCDGRDEEEENDYDHSEEE